MVVGVLSRRRYVVVLVVLVSAKSWQAVFHSHHLTDVTVLLFESRLT
jgi:hypothetical protein